MKNLLVFLLVVGCGEVESEAEKKAAEELAAKEAIEEEEAAEEVAKPKIYYVAPRANYYDNPGESFELTEIKTTCQVSYDDKSMDIVIHTKNTEKLTDDRVAYLYFTIKKTTLTKVSKENDFENGVIIKPTSDDPPEYMHAEQYSTDPYFPDDEAAKATALCEIEGSEEEWFRGFPSYGSLKCKDLTASIFADEATMFLGKFIDIYGDWSCDEYLD